MKQLFKTKLVTAIFIACFCFSSVHLFAQIINEKKPYPEKKLSFESLTIDDGLSQGMINCITQDRFGFMWFATKDGLNRYDGYHFVIYRHDVNNKNSLADNYTNYVFEDSKGRLWVGTASKGLDLFGRATETFIHFTYNEKDSNSIYGNNIVEIKENRQGIIFITTTQGLCFLQEKKNKNGKTDFSFSAIDKSSFGCRSYPADNGMVWITPGDNRLYCLTGNKESGFVRREISFKNYPPGTKPKDYKPFIQSITHDTANHVLYFIRYNAIIKYDERTGNYENISSNRFKIGYITQSALYSSGNIWMPADWMLLMFNVQNKTTVRIKSNDPKYDRVLYSTNCVYEDRSGNLWLGTAGYGLLKYNARAEKFHHTDNASIGWMREDNNGNILIVKISDVVWVFDKKTRSYTKKLPDSSSIAKGKFFWRHYRCCVAR